MRDLQGRLANLKRTYTENEINVQKAKGQADMAAELANRAETVSLASLNHTLVTQLLPCKES